ncbi:MAG TPA: Ig-like domain-containing protein, partial [Pyrinomonadaceae bacterium]|nr:Ig-like domain-containing protein [Pyrinomonadaceae bacterium]
AITGTPSDPTLFIGVQKQNGLGAWSQPGGEILPQAPPPAGGPARKIESPDSRVQKVVFRNGSIYYCQTVGLPAGRTAATIDRTAAQWTQVSAASGNYVQGGRVEDPGATAANGGKWYAFPSLSVNKYNDVLVGFTQFASNQSPAAGFSVHIPGDPPGSMREPYIYRGGWGCYYEKTLTGTRNLWGLYSDAHIDPSDDRRILTIQQFAETPVGTGPNSGRWGTAWAHVIPYNRKPVVSITSPASGAVYVEPATIQLTATASDLDGQITWLDFFHAKGNIGPGVETSPGVYKYTWTNVPAGEYTVKSYANDNDYGHTVSAPVTITVKPVTALSDDFNDNSADAAKWDTILPPGMTVVEQNRRLEITTPSSGVGYGGYHARETFNLTNRRATVEMVQAAYNHSLDTYFVLHDKTTDRNSYFFAIGGNPGLFLMQETFNGVRGEYISIPYDPAQHRFWRIRHDPAADTVNWETSPDGLQWTVRLAAPRRFDVSNLQARLYAGRYTTTSPPHVAVFDNYRVEDNPPSRDLLADNFNDNSTDTSKWAVGANNGMTVAERNQRLEITPPASDTGYGGYYSTTLNYDLTYARATVEVVQATQSLNGIETYFTLEDRATSNNLLRFVKSGGYLIAQSQVNGGMSSAVVPYDPVQHRFWRIQHHWDDDTITWETSADGVAWAILRRIQRTFYINWMQVQLLAGKFTAGTPTSTAVFDNLRVERPHPALAPSDNFNDNSLDPMRWQLMENSPVQVREQNQRLEIALVPNTAAYNGVSSVPSVDFHDKTVQVEMVQTVSFAGWAENYFELRRDDNNAFYFAVGGQGTFVCDAKTNGVL